MPATESLTIEIQGDSSGLSQSLDDALSQVESLQTAASGASNTAGGIGSRLATVSTALQPLQQVAQQLSLISQRAQALSQQPISLNVQPALSALQQLMSAIQAVAAQLNALSVPRGPSLGPGAGPGGGPSPGLNGPRSNFSVESLITSTSAASAASTGVGTSSFAYSAPTNSPLTTSPVTSSALAVSVTPFTAPLIHSPLIESPRTGSIIRQPLLIENLAPAAQVLVNASQLPMKDIAPTSKGDSHDLSPTDSRSVSAANSPFTTNASSNDRTTQLDHSSSTVNHFGGITIEVRETGDVNALMRDLRLQGLSTRHRQG